MAIETEFGWVIAGNSHSCSVPNKITSHNVSILTDDDILREIEEKPTEGAGHLCPSKNDL